VFHDGGRRTREAELVKRALAASGINFGTADEPGRFTVVVYRIDPVVGYQFVLTMLGVRDRTPMYGPEVYDDLRRRRGGPSSPPNPYGFQAREGIGDPKSVQHFPESDAPRTWSAWLSYRGDHKDQLFINAVNTFRNELVPVLDLLLGHQTPGVHLYPELWNRERRALVSLSKAMEACHPLSTVDELISQLKQGVRSALPSSSPGYFHVGVFLHSGSSWRLAGSADAALPERVDQPEPGRTPDDPILTVVQASTRPMLLLPQGLQERRTAGADGGDDVVSRPGWRQRFIAGDASGRLAHLVDHPQFSGAMVLPVLYPYDTSMTIALVVVIGVGTRTLSPSDLFVVNSLATEMGQQISPHLPIAGYPYWPDPANSDEWRRREEQPPLDFSGQEWKAVAERATARMLPETRWALDPLSPGKSGTRVYRVDVQGRNHSRLPMALKVGSAEAIVSEVMRFERFVEDTSIGQSSRVRQRVVIRAHRSDAAGGVEPGLVGAVLYTFVGGGDRVVQWTQWARTATVEEFTAALLRLCNRLDCWYDHARPLHGSVLKRVIHDEFLAKKVEPRRRKQWDATGLSSPSPTEVIDQLKRLNTGVRDVEASTMVSIIHGDLHAGNVFSIEPSVRVPARVGDRPVVAPAPDVALIDWGLTDDGQFVMLDLAKLAADLLFHVWWQQDGRRDEWAALATILTDQLSAVAGLHANRCDWRFAYVHYLAKMLFYVDKEATKESEQVAHLCPEARQAAYASLDAHVTGLIDGQELPLSAGVVQGA